MKKVLLLLAKGFEIYEASVFIDVIGWNLIDGDGSTELFTCGINKELKSAMNFLVKTDYSIDEINADDFDALAIPGGFEVSGFYEDAYNEQFLNVIRRFDKSDKKIASVCTGALPVGKSGVLRGRNATTYNFKNGIRRKELASYGANIIDQPIVIDKNIITSWNPSTAMGVAFKLLELLTSAEQCNYIKKIMGF